MSKKRAHLITFHKIPIGTSFVEYRPKGSRALLEGFVLEKVDSQQARDAEGNLYYFPMSTAVRVRHGRDSRHPSPACTQGAASAGRR